MAAFTWMQMFFCAKLLLQVTAAATGQLFSYFVVTVGDNVTLPCGNVSDDQDGCQNTDWLFVSNETSVVTLVKSVQTQPSQVSGLRLMDICSLHIGRVTIHDVGIYTCRRTRAEASVFLSVVTMQGRRAGNGIHLSCTLWVINGCWSKVRWLRQGGEEVEAAASGCYATIYSPDSRSVNSSAFDSLTCEVTSPDGSVQTFPFSPTNETPDVSGFHSTGWLRIVIVSVGLTTLIIIVVTVNIWTRTKGSKTQMNPNMVHGDEDKDEGTVENRNVGDPSASVQLH